MTAVAYGGAGNTPFTPIFSGCVANGTITASTAVQNNNVLAIFEGDGFGTNDTLDGSGGANQFTPGARVKVTATENWSNGHSGAQLQVITAGNANVGANTWTFGQDGSLTWQTPTSNRLVLSNPGNGQLLVQGWSGSPVKEALISSSGLTVRSTDAIAFAPASDPTAASDTAWTRQGAASINLTDGSTNKKVTFSNSGVNVKGGQAFGFGWSNNSSDSSTATLVAFTLDSSGSKVVDLGNGASQDKSGTLNLAALGVGGSAPANGIGLESGTNTQNFFESSDGSGSGVSGASTGRIRYNNSTAKWEASVQVGAYASLGGTTVTTLAPLTGTAAIAGDPTDTAVGVNASAPGANAYTIALGANTSGSFAGSIAIGGNTSTGSGGVYDLAVGYSASTTAAHQAVFGGSTGYFSDVYLGAGVASAANGNCTIHGTASNTNGTNGFDLSLAGGLANQASDSGGFINFLIAAPSTGITLNKAVSIRPGGGPSLQLTANGVLAMTSSATDASGIPDTSLFRGAAGVVQAGTGAQNTNGSFLGRTMQTYAGTSTTSFNTGGLILSPTTAVGTGNDMTEDTLMSVLLPGNSLSATGKMTVYEGGGTTTAGGTSVTLKVYFGTQVVFNSGAIATTGTPAWWFHVIVVKTGSNTQDILATMESGATTLATTHTSGTQNDGGMGITIKVTGTNTVAQANGAQQTSMPVWFYN